MDFMPLIKTLFQENEINNHYQNNHMMNSKELFELMKEKNLLLAQQTRRIKLLEEKMTDLRKKYFQLKYTSISLH